MLKKLYWIIIVLSLLGTIVSSYALVHHYSSEGSSFCDLSESVSCDIVNKSKYSEIFNIPVAGIGILGYLFILGASFSLLKKKNKELMKYLLVATTLAVLFTSYLTYIEEFILGVYCPLCILSAIFIVLIWGINIYLYKNEF